MNNLSTTFEIVSTSSTDAFCSDNSIIHERVNGSMAITIDARISISSIAYLADGRHIVGGCEDGNLRFWNATNGKELKTLTMAAGRILDVAVSKDGKWVVIGAESGQVTVLSMESHSKVIELKGHRSPVSAVDISPDGWRIATGSDDRTVCYWCRGTGNRLHVWTHEYDLAAVKFSSDGTMIATATGRPRNSVRIYNTSTGFCLVDHPIRPSSLMNQSLAWAHDGNRNGQLFVLSDDGSIHCLDGSSEFRTVSKWSIGCDSPRCIALANNGMFIAASTSAKSLSFWNTETHQPIECVVDHDDNIRCMAISTSCDLVTVTANHKITFHDLCYCLPSPYRDIMRREREIRHLVMDKQFDPEQIIRLFHARDERSNTKIADLEKKLSDALSAANQKEKNLNHTIGDLHMLRACSEKETTHLQEKVSKLEDELAMCQREARKNEESFRRVICAHEEKDQCEELYADNRIHDVVTSLLKLEKSINEFLKDNKPVMDWLSKFTDRCISKLEEVGNEASSTGRHEEALAACSDLLSLSHSPSNTVLETWVKMILTRRSVNEVLDTATKFKVPKFSVYMKICDILESSNRTMEAVACFRQMQDILSEAVATHSGERVYWELDFQRRCTKKLEQLGDASKNSREYNEAIRYYSNALSLDSMNAGVVLKCYEARVGLLEEVLVNVNRVIERYPSSHKGYEKKHAILHRMRRHTEAFEAFSMMLSKLESSRDPQIRELRNQYVDVTNNIRTEIEKTTHEIPHMLINIATGHLYDKAKQMAAFEKLSKFNELRSSMTTSAQVDLPRIQMEIRIFYRYVTLSHKWEPDELTFESVNKLESILKLPATSPTNKKVIGFCQLARSLNICWAWIDTICINQADKSIQQESIIAMFRWFCGSYLTVVHLLGVLSASQEEDRLSKSIWNTRGWTFQEYVASRVVQFYTEDWKPYLGLNMFNHKDSPEIRREMERAMDFCTKELNTLKPGLERVREKLYLASKRETMRQEDIAYSLFGIFDASIPVMYGEGRKRAVRRLLEHILTHSEDVMILSWIGTADSQSSFPMDLTVYNQIEPPHLPEPMDAAEMDRAVINLRSSIPDLCLAIPLYKELFDKASLPLFAAGRLRLSGLIFPLVNLTLRSKPNYDIKLVVYHATSPLLGDVQIETVANLVDMDLLLFHPWIGPLLDLDFCHRRTKYGDEMQALRFIVKLRQQFGALLLTSEGRVHYRRVATDSLIKIRIREGTSLSEMKEVIGTVDIL